jgi:DNA-binding LacI/PurR family transcriptional regulator
MASSTSLRQADVESHATIYDVARLAGVATSTVSRALSHPGRVSFRTAAHVRQVADRLCYRAMTIEPSPQRRRTWMLAMLVADLTNPVFHGMIRGAERTTAHAGHTLLILETRGSERAERDAVERVLAAVDGVILTSSRMSDGEVREVAKQVPLVTIDRIVGQVTAVMSDTVKAMKVATEHLRTSGIGAITYLAGPAGSWLDGMRWLALRQACLELDINVRRIGPLPPSAHGGALAVDGWLRYPTLGVIAFTDIVAIGFIRAVMLSGLRVPEDVNVIGFDDSVNSTLIEPRLTTIAPPFARLGSAAARYLLEGRQPAGDVGPLTLPARLVVRDTTNGMATRRY